MKGLWWQSTQLDAQEIEEYRKRMDATLSATQSSTFIILRQQLITAFLVAGTVLVMYLLYQWSTVLLLVVIGAVTCTVTFRLLLDSKQEQPASATNEVPQIQAMPLDFEETLSEPAAVQAVAQVEKAAEEEVQTVPMPGEAPTVPVTTQVEVEQTPLFLFPDTPMPSAPLVRVLDTIDLSSSNIEHFIKTAEHPAMLKAQETAEKKAKELEVNE
jgi:hypothetical protein